MLLHKLIKSSCVAFCSLAILGSLSLCTFADKVDNYVKSQPREQHIPGLSLAIIRNGKIIKSGGYGLANVELKVPATPETVYPLASLTKPFTAAAIMLLVQDGKLNLDDKISRFLKETPANWREITVRQLLTHTSGIKDYLNEANTNVSGEVSREELAEAAENLSAAIGPAPLNFVPGSQSLYSNTGYLVLGIIIQKLSGKSYDQFLAERVLQPLGMSQTRRNSPDDIIPNRAAGYSWAESSLHNTRFIHPALYGNADAGLISSVLDLSYWDEALYGDKILNAASRTQMWSPMKLSDGSAAATGFGWVVKDINGHRIVFHTGNRPDASTFIARYLDDRLTVIVLTNLDGANTRRIAHHLACLYVPAPIERPIADKEPEVTALVKSLLLRMQDGTVTSEAFVPGKWDDAAPAAMAYVRRMISSGGPFKSIDLLMRDEKQGERSYRYRAVFRDQSVIVDIVFSKEGKIS